MNSDLGGLGRDFSFFDEEPAYPPHLCTCSLGPADSCPYHFESIPPIERASNETIWQAQADFDQFRPPPSFSAPIQNTPVGYFTQQASDISALNQFARLGLEQERPPDPSFNIWQTYNVGDKTAPPLPSNVEPRGFEQFPVFTPGNGTLQAPTPAIDVWSDPGPDMQPLRKRPTYAEAAALPKLNTQQPLPANFDPNMLTSPEVQFEFRQPDANTSPSEPVRKKLVRPISIPIRQSRNATCGSSRQRDRSPSIRSTASRRSNVSKRSNSRRVSAARLSALSADLRCSVCHRRFDSRSSLNHHEQNHLNDEDRPFQCIDCGKGFLWQKDLDRHLTKHTKVKHFRCMLCTNKTFTRHDNLRRHYSNDHPDVVAPSTAGSRTGTTANSSQS